MSYIKLCRFNPRQVKEWGNPSQFKPSDAKMRIADPGYLDGNDDVMTLSWSNTLGLLWNSQKNCEVGQHFFVISESHDGGVLS